MLKKLLITMIIISGSRNAIAAATSPPATSGTQSGQSTTSGSSAAAVRDSSSKIISSHLSGENAANNSSASNSTKSKTFKLTATKINMGLEQLNDVGLDLKNVLTTTRHLYDEVTIQPVSVITEPEMIAAVVIYIPVGVQPTGPPAQPRKDRVDLMMSRLKPVITLLQQNANDFMTESQIANFPEDAQPKLDPLFKKWLAYMDDVYGRLLDLEKLTVGPTYNNYAIAETCQLIEKDIKQIDDVRRPIYKILQEEGKRLSP